MSCYKNLEIDDYFYKQLEKVFIDRKNILGIETFEQYLSHRYRNNCYFYSAYAIMGLENTDKIVRGRINLNKTKSFTLIKEDKSDYFHGWVEFKYKNKYYVFDSILPTIVTKTWYYKNREPVINYEKTLEEIIKMCITDENTKQIEENIYQTGNMYMKYYQSGGKINDKTYLSIPLSDSIIELEPGKNRIKKFITDDYPNG